MSQLTDALLDAHVQHVLAAWRGDSAARLIAERVSSLWRWFGEVTLDQVATRAQVMGIIRRHVIELGIGAGITELAGEFSQLVFSSRRSAMTRLDQVLTEDDYEEFADKVIALDGVRRGLIAMLARSQAFDLFKTRVLAHSLSALVFRRERLRDVAGDLVPALEERVKRALIRYFGQRESTPGETERELIELIDPESLRSLIDDLWAGLGPRPLTEAFSLIGGQDLEDFVVLGYEFWLRYRKSDYFRQIMEEMVGHFFGKYGRLSLAELLEDMGVTEEMLTRELEVFLVPVLDEAARAGFLEQQIRASLGSFYRSAAAEEILRTKP
jgi:hypothetical protein